MSLLDTPTATILLLAPLAEETAAFVALLETVAQRVLWTESVDEALQLAQNWRPDLVLVDSATPGGVADACRRLLSWRATADERFCPVALVTQPEDTEAATVVQLGVDDVIYRTASREEALLRLALLARIVGRYSNLTHRAREAQAALRQERTLRRRAEALDDLTTIILAEPSFDGMAQRLTDAIVSALRADAGIVYDTDGRGRTARRLYAVGMHELVTLVDGRHIERLAPRLTQDRRTRQVMLSEDETEGEPWAVLAKAMLKPSGHSALVVLGRRGEAFFGSHEIRLFDQMVERAAQAMSHARVGEQTAQELQAQTEMVRALHHRVRNNLQAMSALLSFQLMTRASGSQGVTGTLRRIRGMAAIQDMTFRYPGDAIPLAAIVQQVAAEHATTRGEGQRVEVTLDVDDVSLTAERAQVVGLVLEELVSNARDHGLGSGAGIVRLAVMGGEDGVTVVVEDSGGHLPPDFCLDAWSGSGLHLVQLLLTREFRAALTVDADADRTRFSFMAPWEYVGRLAIGASVEEPPLSRAIEA